MIRKKLNRQQKKRLVTYTEFCDYTGLDEEMVLEFIAESEYSYKDSDKITVPPIPTIKPRANVRKKNSIKVKKKNQKELLLKRGDRYNQRMERSINSKLYLDMDSTENKRERHNGLPRDIIYPKDIEIIFGDNTPEFTQHLFDLARKIEQLSRKHIVLYYELCDVTGLDEETIINFILES
jgi:hypothetical protein